MRKDYSDSSIGALSVGVSPKRSSTGKIVSPIPSSLSNGKEKVIPNYLRASTGSCHDFCKYGRKHSAEEEKPRHTFHSRKSDCSVASTKGDWVKGLEANGKSSVVRSGLMPSIKPTPHVKAKTEAQAKGLNAKPIKKAGARPEGSSSNPTPVEEIKSEVWKDRSRTPGNINFNQTESIKCNTPVSEKELSEGSEIIHIKDTSASPVQNLDRACDTVSGSENPIPIIHDIHVVEEVSCANNGEFAETSNEVWESQSIIKEDDSASLRDIKRQTMVHKVSQSAVSPKILKKDHLAPKKAVESIKPKVKQETLSPVSAVPKSRSNKQATPLVRRSDPSTKPVVASKFMLNTVKQNTPSMPKSRSLIKSTDRVNMTPVVNSKAPLNSPSRQSTTPVSKLKSSPYILRSLGETIVKKQTSKSSAPPKTEEKKMLISLRVSRTPRIARIATNLGLRLKLNKSSSIKLRGSSRNLKKCGVGNSVDKVKEKTIFVVKPEKSYVSPPGRPVKSSSTHHSSSSSRPSLSSFLPGSVNDSDHAVSGGSLKSKGKAPRRLGAAYQQDKELTPYKLKFRRGRVVNIQPDNNTPPTRLKFQLRRVAGRSPAAGKGTAQKSSKKKAESVPDVVTGSIPEAGTVVLRHQDAEGLKKETQMVLLNHVIEETASKLVETRMSKVKALVGAFESVISLQESKPV